MRRSILLLLAAAAATASLTGSAHAGNYCVVIAGSGKPLFAVACGTLPGPVSCYSRDEETPAGPVWANVCVPG